VLQTSLSHSRTGSLTVRVILHVVSVFVVCGVWCLVYVVFAVTYTHRTCQSMRTCSLTLLVCARCWGSLLSFTFSVCLTHAILPLSAFFFDSHFIPLLYNLLHALPPAPAHTHTHAATHRHSLRVSRADSRRRRHAQRFRHGCQLSRRQGQGLHPTDLR
jgi:hypothetical protein